MSILNIVLYIMMFYFIFRLFSTSKRNGKGKQLIDIVASINHHDEFFEGINDMIANCGNPWCNGGMASKAKAWPRGRSTTASVM